MILGLQNSLYLILYLSWPKKKKKKKKKKTTPEGSLSISDRVVNGRTGYKSVRRGRE